LQQCLLDQPVHHGRYPQFARAATRFWDAYTTYRLGPVTAVEQLRSDGRPRGPEIFARGLHRASIDAGAALVGLDAFPRRSHVLSGQGLPKQVQGPRARLFASRRRCLLMLGFGHWIHRHPRPGTRCLRLLSFDIFKRHDSSPSFSFGPSPVAGLLRPLLTSRCASSGRRPFRREARSPQVRKRSFAAQSPHLRRLTFDHKSFAVRRPLALVGFASDAIRVTQLAVYVPHFLSTLGHPRAVVLPFAHCGQLAGGLTPPGSWPCWAHVS
jgi:hypothetical protein